MQWLIGADKERPCDTTRVPWSQAGNTEARIPDNHGIEESCNRKYIRILHPPKNEPACWGDLDAGIAHEPFAFQHRLLRRVTVGRTYCVNSETRTVWGGEGHTVQKLSQRRLTADWLAPRENDCSRMRSKVSSEWLPSYIKATRPVLEIFKMAGYFPDMARIADEKVLKIGSKFRWRPWVKYRFTCADFQKI